MEVNGMKQTWLFYGFGLLTMATAVLSLTGYLGAISFLADLTSHFKVHYAIVSLIALLFWGLTHQWLWMGLSLACLLLNLTAIVPWYFPTVHSTVSTTPLKVLLSNVNYENRNVSDLVELIQTEQPDLVAIVEANSFWLEGLQPIKTSLPYSLHASRSEVFGVVFDIALYSRFPLQPEPVQLIGNESTGLEKSFHLVATVNTPDRPLLVAAIHPPPPITRPYFNQRNGELNAIGASIHQYTQSTKGSAMAIGDLNITPWSPNYHRFMQVSGLKNARQGFGILPTWHAGIPLLDIPIDHCLVSSDIQVKQIKTGRAIGSDHLPLLVEVEY
jgi:endonuclease/exonuclease/phosphatase (EEP) superfamily protein YafD